MVAGRLARRVERQLKIANRVFVALPKAKSHDETVTTRKYPPRCHEKEMLGDEAAEGHLVPRYNNDKNTAGCCSKALR